MLVNSSVLLVLWGPKVSHPKICLNGILIISKELLKKWPIQRDTLLLLSVALNAGNKSLMWKVYFLPVEIEGHPEGIWDWEAQIKKLCYFNSLPQAQTLFRVFTVWAPKPQISLSCQFLINLFLCLKTIKAACFGYFLGPFLFFFKLFYLVALGLTCSMWESSSLLLLLLLLSRFSRVRLCATP